MTLREAREIYLRADCSFFIMCNTDYEGYLEYKRLEISKKQEDSWRIEKLGILYRELQRTGNSKAFNRLYDIAVEFRDYDRLKVLMNALDLLRLPMDVEQSISVIETILGRKLPKARSGMVYWAYDLGQRGIMILLFDYIDYILETMPNKEDAEVQKKVRRVKRLSKNIMRELNFKMPKGKFDGAVFSAYDYK